MHTDIHAYRHTCMLHAVIDLACDSISSPIQNPQQPTKTMSNQKRNSNSTTKNIRNQYRCENNAMDVFQLSKLLMCTRGVFKKMKNAHSPRLQKNEISKKKS